MIEHVFQGILGYMEFSSIAGATVITTAGKDLISHDCLQSLQEYGSHGVSVEWKHGQNVNMSKLQNK